LRHMDDRWMAERALRARRPSVNLVHACSCRDAVAWLVSSAAGWDHLFARGQGPVEELGVGSVTAARAREEEYHPLSDSHSQHWRCCRRQSRSRAHVVSVSAARRSLGPCSQLPGRARDDEPVRAVLHTYSASHTTARAALVTHTFALLLEIATTATSTTTTTTTSTSSLVASLTHHRVRCRARAPPQPPPPDPDRLQQCS
jgi:hypothetical protein